MKVGIMVQTKMAAAFTKAFEEAVASGTYNTGRVGRRILTNNAKGLGQKFYRGTLTLQNKNKAETAVKKGTIQ